MIKFKDVINENVIMSNLIESINKYHLLNEIESDAFIRKVKQEYFDKKDIIIKKGSMCNRIFFIEKGLVKYHHNVHEQDKTIRFFAENEFFTSIQCYSEGKPARYEALALENTYVSSIRYSDLEELTNKYIGITILIDKIFASAALHILNLMHTHIDIEAAERYQYFETQYPHLLNRLNLKEIASYLNISQVSLSRIRSARVSKLKKDL